MSDKPAGEPEGRPEPVAPLVPVRHLSAKQAMIPLALLCLLCLVIGFILGRTL